MSPVMWVLLEAEDPALGGSSTALPGEDSTFYGSDTSSPSGEE